MGIGGGRRAWDDLVTQYYEWAQDGQGLISFIQAALAGRFGPYDKNTFLSFLDLIEAILLANIEEKWQEGPMWPQDPQTVRQAVVTEVDDARTLVLDHFEGP